MTKLKLLFFVNGVEGSAVGVRAEIFATRLPQDWKIDFCYRPRKKWQGIWAFVQSAIAFQPDIIYVMDTAYTGVLASILSQQLTGCKLITDTGDVAYELAKSKATYSKPQLSHPSFRLRGGAGQLSQTVASRTGCSCPPN